MKKFEKVIAAVKNGQDKDFEFSKFNVIVRCGVNYDKVAITDKKGEGVIFNTIVSSDTFNMGWATRWAQNFLKFLNSLNAVSDDAKEIAEIAEDILNED